MFTGSYRVSSCWCALTWLLGLTEGKVEANDGFLYSWRDYPQWYRPLIEDRARSRAKSSSGAGIESGVLTIGVLSFGYTIPPGVCTIVEAGDGPQSCGMQMHYLMA